MKVFQAGLFVALVCALFALPAQASGDGNDTKRPNIVLILADDLGYGDLSSYGHWSIETPHLDRLAEQGVRLTSYYAASPLCSPSRASLLTGRMPYRTGVKSWIPSGEDVQLNPDEKTLASLLGSVGYETAVIGKWHLNGGLDVAAHAQPIDHGFDYSFVLHAYALPHHQSPTNFYRNGEPLGELEGFAAELVVDDAIAWLEAERASRAPFFLFLPFVEPHGTLASPKAFLEKYARFTSGEPVPFPNGLPQPPDGLEARGPGEYYANVSHLDDQIGRLLQHLDKAQLTQDTIILVVSDNGPVTTDWRQWWETNLYGQTGGFRGRKGDLFEGGIRVPGIIRFPGVIPPNSVSDAVVHGYDIAPTLLRLARAPIPSDRAIDGLDVLPQLLGQRKEPVRSLYWALPRPGGANYAMRRGDWKLLADRFRKPIALYNLRDDPFEHVNTMDERPTLVEDMSHRLNAYFAAIEDAPPGAR
ncbi:MAG: sulfatase-like hydrolase/transferase [Pseudomonadota bacterium]